MNICTPGNCICNAAEWAGDTNCMGEIEGVGLFDEPLQNWSPRYYLDHEVGVVFSVQESEMLEGITYFYDPTLERPVV